MLISFGKATPAATCIALNIAQGTAHPAQHPLRHSRAVASMTPSLPAPISAYPSTGPLAMRVSPNVLTFSHAL